MGISDEELLSEEISLEFNSGPVDGEAEDLENPGDDLEKTDPVASSDDEGGGIAGIGVVNGDG